MIFVLCHCLSMCVNRVYEKLKITVFQAHTEAPAAYQSAMHLSQASKTPRKKKKNTLHTLINTHAPCTYPLLCIYTQRHTPFSQTDSPTLTSVHTDTHTHNYISTLGVWQRRGKNQSGRPGTWMNRLSSKPHQRHRDDLPQTSIFSP